MFDGENVWHPPRHAPGIVLLRGWGLGLAAGAVAGAVLGTVIVPIVGTIIGFLYGAFVAALYAVPCALTLALLTSVLTDPHRAALAGAVIALVWATPALGVLGVYDSPRIVAAGLVLCCAIGAVVGPRAVFRRAPRRARRADPATP